MEKKQPNEKESSTATYTYIESNRFTYDNKGQTAYATKEDILGQFYMTKEEVINLMQTSPIPIIEFVIEDMVKISAKINPEIDMEQISTLTNTDEWTEYTAEKVGDWIFKYWNHYSYENYDLQIDMPFMIKRVDLTNVDATGVEENRLIFDNGNDFLLSKEETIDYFKKIIPDPVSYYKNLS